MYKQHTAQKQYYCIHIKKPHFRHQESDALIVLLLVLSVTVSCFSVGKSNSSVRSACSLFSSHSVCMIIFSFSLRSFSTCCRSCSLESCRTFWYVFRMSTACRRQHSASGICFNFLMLCRNSWDLLSLSLLLIAVFMSSSGFRQLTSLFLVLSNRTIVFVSWFHCASLRHQRYL